MICRNDLFVLQVQCEIYSLGSWITSLTSFKTALSHKVLQHYYGLTVRWVLMCSTPNVSERCVQPLSKKNFHIPASEPENTRKYILSMEK